MRITRSGMITTFKGFLAEEVEVVRFTYTSPTPHDDWKFQKSFGGANIAVSLWSFTGPTRTHITPAQRRRALATLHEILNGGSQGELRVHARVTNGTLFVTYYPTKNHYILTGVR